MANPRKSPTVITKVRSIPGPKQSGFVTGPKAGGVRPGGAGVKGKC